MNKLMPGAKSFTNLYFILRFITIGLLFFKINPSIGQSITDARVSISGCVILGYCVNVNTTYQGNATISLNFDQVEGYQPNGEDVQLSAVLKTGDNCVKWDGFNGKGKAIADGFGASILIETNGATYKSEIKIYLICPPIANDDRDSTAQNLELVVNNPKLGANDEYTLDIDNQIIYTALDKVLTLKGGIITLSTKGTYIYQPPQNYIGTDEFSYKICYTKYPSICDSAIVVVSIRGTGFELPVAKDDYYTVKLNKTLENSLLANDIGASICNTGVQNATTNAGGKLVVLADGNFTYTPALDYIGKDSFGYQICNAIQPQLCDSAWVYIQVVDFKDVEIPTGFTPNNDGKNDFFEIRNIEFYPDNEVVISNRWGSVVYEQQNYNNTDIRFEGKSNNIALPEGTYFYKVDLKQDDIAVKSGYFIIIR